MNLEDAAFWAGLIPLVIGFGILYVETVLWVVNFYGFPGIGAVLIGTGLFIMVFSVEKETVEY